MTRIFPPAPNMGDALNTAGAPPGLAEFLATRRSSGKAALAEPGPDESALAEILRIAARIPDHRRVEPWRFITFTGPAREKFGTALAGIAETRPAMSASDVAQAAGLLLRAPVVVAVISSPDAQHKTPVWEQELSCGALCHNLLLAARASGFGAVWLSEWISFDHDVDALLGLKPGERVAGYVYIGTPTAEAPERPRPDMAAKVSAWGK
ncbi:MAG: nitroreductase [Hyphomonadaceae bacterium]|nr:nitroreductase [Hyphomonadaceae bacterium]